MQRRPALGAGVGRVVSRRERRVTHRIGYAWCVKPVRETAKRAGTKGLTAQRGAETVGERVIGVVGERVGGVRSGEGSYCERRPGPRCSPRVRVVRRDRGRANHRLFDYLCGLARNVFGCPTVGRGECQHQNQSDLVSNEPDGGDEALEAGGGPRAAWRSEVGSGGESHARLVRSRVQKRHRSQLVYS